jgi:sugar (pentulose or hexulose) kinase
MAGARFTAVLDVGHSNIKLAVVDTETETEVWLRKSDNRLLQSPPYPHFDVDHAWRFFRDALREAARHHAIGALAVAAHGASATLIDGNGRLAFPILDYQHDGPDSVRAAYETIRPPFAETLSPALPLGLNVGAQLYWQQKQFPEIWDRVAYIVPLPQYWVGRLCGRWWSEATSWGCHTDLWRTTAQTYSPLVDALSIRALLPPLASPFDVAGELLPEVAAETGLPKGLPVHVGLHDSNASLLPHLLAREGKFSVVSTGTWTIIFAVGGNCESLKPERDTLAYTDALGRPVPAARFMGGREFELLCKDCPEATPQDVAAVLAEPIVLLPAVENRSGPFQGRSPSWLPREVQGGQRHAAASFYLALMTDTCLNLCDADGPIIVEGPLAKNREYLDMLRVAAGRQVLTAQSATSGTTIGAALTTRKDRKSPVSLHVEHLVGIDGNQHLLRRWAEAWRTAIGS